MNREMGAKRNAKCIDWGEREHQEMQAAESGINRQHGPSVSKDTGVKGLYALPAKLRKVMG